MFLAILTSTIVSFSSTYALSEYKYQGYLSDQTKLQLFGTSMVFIGALLWTHN